MLKGQLSSVGNTRIIYLGLRLSFKQLISTFMLRIFLAIIGLCALTALTAQIGFSAQYLNGQGDNWTYRPAELEENTIDQIGRAHV